MATLIALNSMSATTQPTDTPMDGNESCSSAQAKKSSYEPAREMPSSPGESSKTTVGSKASIAPSSGTSHDTAVRNSFAKRMRLLIASGLIAGITPTSIAKRWPQGTLDFAFSQPDGNDADGQRED
ncbi:hypothetical protein [Ralstonia mannitolilytica]|uniref:hypothetical protein n=1 Tax=Ralstonia mannitolilytica TaxID=105219 RepID=UPI0018D341B7|nr:hypothetical protein [Ralstonia mannitolilytica]